MVLSQQAQQMGHGSSLHRGMHGRQRGSRPAARAAGFVWRGSNGMGMGSSMLVGYGFVQPG